MKAIYGLFPGPDSAQRALDSLEEIKTELGFDDRDIIVLSGEPYEEYGFGQRDRKTPMPWLAGLGGLIGALCGLGLVSVTQQDYPLVTGGMAIVPSYPLAIITYELAMLGAILSTMVVLLVSARLPDWRSSKLYDPAVSNGKILIGVVSPPEAVQPELLKSLYASGADVVKEVDKSHKAKKSRLDRPD